MNKLMMIPIAAIAVAAAAPAFAEMATVTTDLNVRAGPGTQNPVIGRVGAGQSVNVNGCLATGGWCSIATAQGEGWVSSGYLSGGGTRVIIDDNSTAAVRVDRPVSSPGAGAGFVAGGATGAVAGAVVGGPIGAAIGGVGGAIVGGSAGQILDPPARVRTYVSANRMNPVRLEGNYVVGATIPADVELRQVPDYDYEYVYVNGRPMLVEPGSRRIVYVYE